MRISLKPVFLSLFALCFCFVGYSQNNGNQLMTKLLKEERVNTKDNTASQNVDKAMRILDDRKESGKITEVEFQQQLNELMSYQKVVRNDVVSEKMEASEKNRKEYLAKKERGETKDIFDMSKDRLKVKLEKGTITQSQYDTKLKSLNERQAARKAIK